MQARTKARQVRRHLSSLPPSQRLTDHIHERKLYEVDGNIATDQRHEAQEKASQPALPKNAHHCFRRVLHDKTEKVVGVSTCASERGRSASEHENGVGAEGDI